MHGELYSTVKLLKDANCMYSKESLVALRSYLESANVNFEADSNPLKVKSDEFHKILLNPPQADEKVAFSVYNLVRKLQEPPPPPSTTPSSSPPPPSPPPTLSQSSQFTPPPTPQTQPPQPTQSQTQASKKKKAAPKRKKSVCEFTSSCRHIVNQKRKLFSLLKEEYKHCDDGISMTEFVRKKFALSDSSVKTETCLAWVTCELGKEMLRSSDDLPSGGEFEYFTNLLEENN